MCSIEDARRHQKIAEIFEAEENREEARQHYLEAASIYVLQAELSKNDECINHANACYAKAQEMNREQKREHGHKTYTKQELAKRTLEELQEFEHSHHHDALAEIREHI